jgi:hypothetical protein
MALVSYTGLAFVEEKPTDYWLAQELCGLPIDFESDQHWALCTFDGRPQPANIGGTLRGLEHSVRRAFASPENRHQYFELAISRLATHAQQMEAVCFHASARYAFRSDPLASSHSPPRSSGPVRARANSRLQGAYRLPKSGTRPGAGKSPISKPAIEKPMVEKDRAPNAYHCTPLSSSTALRDEQRMNASTITLPPIDPNRRYSIELAVAYLDQSRSKTYQQIKAGQLPSFKDGKRRYISGAVIIARSTQQ